MKKNLLLLIIILLFSELYSQNYKALFIGNSYTASYNLGSLVASLASVNGDSLYQNSYTPGGYTFQQHSQDQAVITLINSQAWDFVVLQEQSQLPSFPPAQVASDCLPYATKLDSIIKAHDTCTETVFFMTWGRKYGDMDNCQYYPPVCTYNGMQARLRESYMLMAQQNNATVVPAGMAWKRSWDTDTTIDLWSGDFSHPSLEGSYLTACVFYATMFGKSPVGIPYYSTLNQQVAGYLQQIAAATVFDSLSQWTSTGDIPYAKFNYTSNYDTVFFNDQSVNALYHYWNFGDGNFSVQPNPYHKYQSSGKYYITHKVQSACRTHEMIDSVQIISTGNFSGYVNHNQWNIYPNPTSGKLNIEFLNSAVNQQLELLNPLGSCVYKTILSNGKSFEIDLSEIPKGLYFIKLNNNQENSLKKLIIK